MAGVQAPTTGYQFVSEVILMGAAENKEVVPKMREAKGIDAILSTMGDDVRWTLIGTTKFSGTLNGKQEIVEKLFKPIFAQLEHPGSNVIDNIIAEGDYVVVQQRGTGRRTKTGKDYNNTYASFTKLATAKS
jgi:uncharacterized protein